MPELRKQPDGRTPRMQAQPRKIPSKQPGQFAPKGRSPGSTD